MLRLGPTCRAVFSSCGHKYSRRVPAAAVFRRVLTVVAPPLSFDANAEAPAKLDTWSSFKRTTRFATVARREILYGLLFLPAALSSTLALPFFVGTIIDSVVGPLADVGSLPVESLGGFTELQVTVAALLGISVFGAAASTGRSYFINLASEKIVQHLRKDLFSDVLRKEVEFFDRNKTGDLMNRLSADVALVGSVLTESVSMALRGAATLTLGTAFLFYTSWELALVSTASLAPMLLLSRLYGDFIKRRSKEQLEVFGVASSVAEEFIGNIRSTLIFNRQAHAGQRYADQVDAAFAIGRDVALRRGLFMGSTNFVLSMSILAALGYGSMMVANGALSPGQLTTFLLYSVNVAGASFQLTSVYSALMRALGATDRILEVFDHVPPQQAGTTQLPQLVGRIEFRDLTFAYPTRPDAAVFEGLNLVVPAGKVVAILGGSGSGKSTLTSLLTRLYEPQRGAVTLDGTALEDLDVTWLRENIGSVTQDATIFQGTIRDNILFGNLDASPQAVEEAARLANAYDFVAAFPDGFETTVGERGTLLSGGQKQRICIARAILKNPRVLVLDEATSALDVESERLVQEALERLMKDRTTLVITHRLSTVKNADFIAVIEDGHVIEFGTRDEVLQIDGGRFAAYLQQTKLGAQP